MNTHAAYRRHGFRPPQPSRAEPSGATVSQLARHRDPSLGTDPTPIVGSNRVAWVRPTELATYTGPAIGRGIDLQTELVRRARRTPATATRSLHRPVPEAAAAQPATREEGLGL